MKIKLHIPIFLFLCVNVPSVYFIIVTGKPSGNTNMWGDLASLATIDIALLTSFLVFYGGSQLASINVQAEETKKHNKDIIAHAAYSEFLKLAMQYPEFAHPNPLKLDNNYQLKNQYKWFVANMLYHFETVVEAVGRDDDWEETLKPQINKHGWYIFKHDRYKNDGWSTELKLLIESSMRRSVNYKKQVDTFVQVKSNCDGCYQKYLDLLLSNHHLIAAPLDKNSKTHNVQEQKVFIKQVFYILGELLQASEKNPIWKKTVINELKNLEWYFNDENMNVNDPSYFVNEQHKTLIIQHNYKLRRHYV